MMSRFSFFPPIAPPLRGIGLIFLSALVSLLFCLGIGGLFGSEELIHHWQGHSGLNVLIALPPLSETTSDIPPDKKNSLQYLQDRLEKLTGASQVQSLESATIQSLLSAWGASWPAPLPHVLRLHYEGDITLLRQAIHQMQPSALVMPPSQQDHLVPALSHALRQCAFAFACLTGLGACIIFLAGLSLILRANLLREHHSLALLHQLGGTQRLLYGRMAWMAGVYSLLGSAGAVAILYSIIHLSGHGTFRTAMAACLLPFCLAGAGWGAACFMLHLHGKRMTTQ